MRAALVIAGKDLRQRIRDRSAIAVALVAPLVLASIFGLILHDVGIGKLNSEYVIADADHGAVAREFASHIRRAVTSSGIGTVETEQVFPSAAREIARFTPHSWGNEAFSTLRDDGGGLGDILPELGVLLLFAAALISLATYRLRHVITR